MCVCVCASARIIVYNCHTQYSTEQLWLLSLLTSNHHSSDTICWRGESTKTKQELTTVGLSYIHTCRSYVHIPRDFTNGASLAWRLRRRISTLMFTCRWAWHVHLLIRLILGFWEQSSPKWEIPCLGRRFTATPNVMSLALSSAEKSVTVQTNIHKKQ